MTRKSILCALFLMAASPLGAVWLLTGCEGDSAESIIRNVEIIIAGFYSNSDGTNSAPIVSRNSGAPITSMNIRQNGDQLEGIDNNGNLFKGTIGSVSQNGSTKIASITLEGPTTAGAVGTIAGSVTVSGGDVATDNNAELRGTWAEPTLFGEVSGTATVPIPEPTEPATET